MTKHEQPSSYQTMTKNKKPNSNEKQQTNEDKVTSDHLKDAAKPAEAAALRMSGSNIVELDGEPTQCLQRRRRDGCHFG